MSGLFVAISHDKNVHMTRMCVKGTMLFFPCICLLQAIEDWRQEWPGNKAKYHACYY